MHVRDAQRKIIKNQIYQSWGIYTMRSTNLTRAIRVALTSGLVLSAFSTTVFAEADSGAITFNAGDLVVTSTVYQGTATPITVGTTNVAGAIGNSPVKATADSSYLNVWNNTKTDGSFGISSPILINDISTSGTTVGTYNLTAIAASQGVNLVTSFSSKSELAVNLSTDGKALTLNGYNTTSGLLDISNSNTPGLIDSTNPTVGISAPTYRSIAQINLDGSLNNTNTNSYSGNNGRATILDSNTNTYYTVGNAGNSGKPAPSGTVLSALSQNTGVQAIAENSTSPNSTVIGQQNGTVGNATGNQYGFSITNTNPLTNQPYATAADKTGKDDNFRGEAVYNNTLYVTKGSGGNGIDTVYQVGPTGGLDNLLPNSTSTAITVLPGFPTALASGTPTNYPFGLWFADSTHLFVADEGAGGLLSANGAVGGVAGTGVAASDNQAGLEEWTLNTTTGVWSETHVWQAGLNLGVSYSVSGVSIGADDQYGAAGTYTAATDGLRALTGTTNADGSYTLYATTSTISNSGDQGADPNKLVAITVAANSTGNESFQELQTAAYGTAFRGVSFAQAGATGVSAAAVVPLPSSVLMMLSGLGLTGLISRRKRA